MTESTVQYVLGSGVWSIVGLVIGYVAGRAELRRTMNDDVSKPHHVKRKAPNHDHS